MRASLSYKQALQRMSIVMDVRQYDAFQAATMLHDFFDGDRDEILHDLLTVRAKVLKRVGT